MACDLKCKAADDWYQSNQSQPKRDQPWYHVLVDGSNQTTYAAQSSLMPDPSGTEINHPLIKVFFSEFAGGFYVRNHEAWPEN